MSYHIESLEKCDFGKNPSIGSRSILHTDNDLGNKVKVTKSIVNSVDCPKGIGVLNWWESNAQEIY